MKKLYTSLAIVIANFSYAQTVDFESINLGANSFYDGSDLSGTPNMDSTLYDSTFVLSGIEMFNQWSLQFGAPGYLSDGWVFSSKTADTTSGLPGAYNSYAGGGADNSTSYAVTFVGSGKTIELENNAVATFADISVTNNTYAAFSMLNGDNIAKKFGGATGDDADFFLLHIIGYDANGNSIDTLEHYLADYRFSDNSMDYIQKEWETIDLSSLGEINKIRFELSSSDNGNFGMNTPSYVVIDNINFGFTTINEVEENTLSIYPNPTSSIVTINNSLAKGNVTLVDLSGRVVMNKAITSAQQVLNVEDLPTGIYTLLLNQNGILKTSKLVKQ